MKTLNDIKSKEERVVNFTTTGSYHELHVLIDEDVELEKADFLKILEDNLAKMLDNGFTNEEIYANSGMYVPDSEEIQELEEFGEFFEVDKGYIINGLFASIGG